MSKRQLIAVDLDEVLAQHNQALALWHNKEYGTEHTAANARCRPFHFGIFSIVGGGEKDDG